MCPRGIIKCASFRPVLEEECERSNELWPKIAIGFDHLAIDQPEAVVDVQVGGKTCDRVCEFDWNAHDEPDER